MPRVRSFLALGFPALLLTACPNAEGDYNDFKDRYNALHPPGEGGAGGESGDAGPCVVPKGGEADGQYLFVLSAVLKPTSPVVFLATVTSKDVATGLELTFTLQALSYKDRQTPVGPALPTPPIVIGADGVLNADLPPLEVDGGANPITKDVAITSDISALKGKICGKDGFYCGTVEGKVTKPLPLDLKGSTWTMTKVTSPSDYPEPPPIDCQKDLATPVSKI